MNQDKLNSWQRLVALAPTLDARIDTFERAVRDLGRDDDKSAVVDALLDMACAHNFFGIGENEIEAKIRDGIARAEQAPKSNGRDQPDDQPLRYVDLAAPLVLREWAVHDRIPMRNVSMLGGEGAIGKSLLLMQLIGAVVLGKDWIGTMPKQGRALYMSCEEDDDEVNRRMEDVARHLGATRQDMIDAGLRFLSFAGEDAVLAQPDRAGIMRPTPLFERLRRDAFEQRPTLIVLDTVADIFAGKENDRAQTRQFITMLRGLAIATESAVVIAAHPSLEGIRSDTGLSGTTGWHNSVRARMYFKAAPGDDPALRVLECRKNQYGPVSESILLRWRDGVYIVEPGKGTLERLAIEAQIDQLFLTLLRRFTDAGRNISDKKSPTYAPKLFAEQPEAKEAKITSKMFADAMERLFAAGKIKIVKEGRPSHQTHRIVETERHDADVIPFPAPANYPANRQPTASQREGGYTPPIPPKPVGRSADRAEGPGPGQPGQEGVRAVLTAWRKELGTRQSQTVQQLVATDAPALRAALLAVAPLGRDNEIANSLLFRWLEKVEGIAVDGLKLERGPRFEDGSPVYTLVEMGTV
jgi:RecA-family ATPase